jgi:rubrerythrin
MRRHCKVVEALPDEQAQALLPPVADDERRHEEWRPQP